MIKNHFIKNYHLNFHENFDSDFQFFSIKIKVLFKEIGVDSGFINIYNILIQFIILDYKR